MDIFIGSLPFKLKESELRELFQKFGEVSSAKIIINKATRQSKGFGFVSMPNDKEALNAIKALDGTELLGRNIEVTKSKEDKASVGEDIRVRKTGEANKESVTWRKNFLRKKPKPSVVTYGDHEKKGDETKKTTRVKKAKNFKVGARKKK
jgi:RNA recognition motif-containing protein